MKALNSGHAFLNPEIAAVCFNIHLWLKGVSSAHHDDFKAWKRSTNLDEFVLDAYADKYGGVRGGIKLYLLEVNVM